MRKLIAISLALAATMGCARVVPTIAEPAPKAVPRVGETKTLARKINLRQPILVGVAEGLVTVTFAERDRNGVTLSLDPISLEARASREFVYAAAPPGKTASIVDLQRSSVTLADGRSFVCSELDILESKSVVGAPIVATVDGCHVVIIFVAGSEAGFELVAVTVDTHAKNAALASF